MATRHIWPNNSSRAHVKPGTMYSALTVLLPMSLRAVPAIIAAWTGRVCRTMTSEALRPHLLEADMVVFATPLYYFGFSSQLKAVIDRFYAINGQIKGAAKKAALLMTYADTAPREAEPLLSHYEALTEYLGWKSVGTVVAPGVWTAGAVRDTRYARQAYRLGKDL